MNFKLLFYLGQMQYQRNVAKDCGAVHSTISTIWKNRDKINALFENFLTTKRSKKSKHKVIEDASITLFKHQIS